MFKMEDQLISFETAKLAKDKGFNWKCLHGCSAEHPKDIHLSFDLTGENYFGIESIYNAEENTDIKHFLLPTQSLLQKWLREEYKIHIRINYLDDVLFFGFYVENIKINTELIEETYGSHDNRFKTYEEALEKGLFETLKLIK